MNVIEVYGIIDFKFSVLEITEGNFADNVCKKFITS